MEKMVRLALLYDFYGELLTEKQRAVFEMSNFNDMSLGEIGEELDITPQGVRDFLKRTEKILVDYESTLGLVKKHIDRKKTVEELTEMIDTLSVDLPEKLKIHKKLAELI